MRFRFLTYEFDAERRELLDGVAPVAIPPKVFDLLGYLVAHRDRMVSKQELMDRFWAANVSEAALQKAISHLRKALDAAETPVIKTHHGLGFRFIAPVETVDTADRPLPPAVALDERRLAAVLCLRLDARTDAALAGFLAGAETAVKGHGGGLLHVLADGFTAAFGLDPPCEDGTRRAVHCAAALMARAADGAEGGIAAAAGIDTGRVDVAGTGSGTPAWALPGEIERGAIALAEGAEPGVVLLSQAARDQVRNEAETEPNAAAGFRLGTVGPIRAGIPARPRRQPARFVGRAAEMAFLATHLDALGRGSGQAVTLSGPAGIGKTRLVAEFLASLDPRAIRAVRLNCLPSLANTPLAPIRELCLALGPEAPEGVIRDATDAALWREILGLQALEPTLLAALSDRRHRQRGSALVARMLAARCAEAPLVLTVEDVHWIDATSRETLQALVEGIDRRRLMMVLTTRPDAGSPVTEAVLHLSPLGQGESLSLLREVCGDGLIAEAPARALVRRAAGNPFFIEELALAARDGGDPAADLPETVQAVTEVRIGVLSPGLRALVYVIAVIGPPAPLDLIAHLLDRPPDAVEADLEALAGMGFVQAGPGGWDFRHILIGDTAYAMVAPNERRRLHAEIAAHLEAETDAGDARPERLAWHFQEAGQTGRALGYWIAASRAALHRSAHHEAVAFARNGLALTRENTPEAARHELELQLCLAPALTALRGFGAEEVGAAYGRAQALNPLVGTAKTEVRVQVGLWIHTWVRGQLAQSLDHAGRLLALADRLPDPALLLQAHASRGQVLVHTGALEAARDHLAAGLTAIEGAPPATIPSQNAAVSCAAYAAWAASLTGRDADLAQSLDRARDLAALHENPFAAAIHHALCAEPFMFRGEAEGCLDHADRAVALSREHDFAFWLGTGLVMRGWALGRLGDTARALAQVDEGIAVFEATGAGVQLANWHGLRAEVLLADGRPRDGLAAADHALACAARAGDIFFTPRIHATAARLHALLDDPAQAAAHRTTAKTLASHIGAADRFILP